MDLTLEAVGLRLAGAELVRPFSLAVAAGEIVTVMGPSGSGKSSLLAFIAGDLDRPLVGTGVVRLGGRDLAGSPPYARRIGRLFQDDLLFPHLTVGENLLFGMPRGALHRRRARMEDALSAAGLAGFAERPPHTLSGGQRARAALFRALLAEPCAMLLDEPFGKLDSDLRHGLRGFVVRHLKERGIPCLLVSHDRHDAPPGGRILRIGELGEVRDD